MAIRKIPIAQPHLGGNERRYVTACVDTNWISSQGTFVKQLEEQFASFIGVEHALCVSNGTTALHLALAALGIGPGDEVLVPDLTFAATANAVIHCGATPVLVDVSPDTWTLDPDLLEDEINDHTRAIIPVHLYGHTADMERLSEFASAHDLFVVEDCAESIGATSYSQMSGGIGDIGCFSFYANKVMTTGEGGMVTTRDPDLYQRMGLLRDHGMTRERRYWHLYPGFNYRLTNLQAAIGLAQLEQMDHFLSERQRIASTYKDLLEHIPGIALPPAQPWCHSVTWLYSILINPDLAQVEKVQAVLSEAGVETRRFFYPLHQQPVYEAYKGKSSRFPVSNELFQRGLSLPTYVGLTTSDMHYIAGQLNQILA